MRAGFSKTHITPLASMAMAGFDRRSESSTGTLDELELRVLVLDDEKGSLFSFVVLDVLGVDHALSREIATLVAFRLNTSEDRVWVCATHTHAAPSAIFSGGKSRDPVYYAWVLGKSACAAEEALRDLQTARLEYGVSYVQGVCSRRNMGREAGSTYPMPILNLRIVRQYDTLNLVRISSHPTVLDEKNTSYSRDLPGAAIHALEREDNMLVVNGACADLSTRYTRRESSPCELNRLGKLLAEGILAGESGLQMTSCEEIKATSQEIFLSRTGSLEGSQRQELLDAWRALMEQCPDAQTRREYDSRIAVLERVAAAPEPARRIHVGAVDFGEFCLVSLPFEVDSPDGNNLEKMLTEAAGKPVFLLCYTWGYDGYLPSGKPLGVDSSYEDIASRYVPQSREQVWECAKQCVLNGMK